MKRLRIFGASVLLLVLFGVAASLYSHISRIAYYDFPFAKVDIDRIEFRSILDNEEVILNDSEEIERLYNLLTKMRISEDLLEPSQNTLLLGNQGFAIKIHTVSGQVPAGCRIRPAGHILSEKCKPAIGKPRHS